MIDHSEYETLVFDIESNNLLNDETIDYTNIPYKLKPAFSLHCIVVQEVETGEIIAFYDGDVEYVFDGRPYVESDEEYTYSLTDYEPIEYTRKYLRDFAPYIESKKKFRVVGHNIINFDLLACKLKLDMDYSVEPDQWSGKDCEIVDTMVLSKTLNPDRFGGHTLDNLAKVSKSAAQKIAFRKKVPIEKRFKTFAADMLYYNIFDVLSNVGVLRYLENERDKGGWDWSDAITLEKQVASVITRQEHRGFDFNMSKAVAAVQELDSYIEDAKSKIEPVLPKKPIGKTEAKKYILNANQFNKGNGEKSKHLLKFVEKHDGEWIGDREVKLYGKKWKLPLPKGEPVLSHVPAEIKDTTHIKRWLVEDLGWVPLEWKDRDLTKKQKVGVGNVKRTQEEFEKAVDNYVTETLNSPFCNYRLEHLGAQRNTLRSKLMKKGLKRSLKVLTNPSFTRGQEKDPCPNLMKLVDKFPYVEDMVKYLTYRHRRNSILGGGFDPEWLDMQDGEEPEKGYIPSVRSDGRIATPADTCGAATSRMKHRGVANIPRSTSLYGAELRDLFGVGEGAVQIGYDFDSLEAREEASYCWRYDPTKEYCNSLLAEKPNSVHCKMARAVSDILRRDFSRNSAKSVRYGIAYGATAMRVAKIVGDDLFIGQQIYDIFWEQAKPLKKLLERLKQYWESKGGKKFIPGIDNRKVPTRSAHSILNSLFQSAGVICAKRAMVIHERKLREEGLLVDFFRDTIGDRSYCQQLIAYHDECQLEADMKSTKWKVFKFDPSCEESEAKAEKAVTLAKAEVEAATGQVWSDIGHTNNTYYIGYHRAGELAVEAVREAGQYYNLNVELTAGYSLGKSWKDCH